MSSADLLKEAELSVATNPLRAEMLYKQILGNTTGGLLTTSWAIQRFRWKYSVNRWLVGNEQDSESPGPRDGVGQTR
jgi:hypothetical protein